MQEKLNKEMILKVFKRAGYCRAKDKLRPATQGVLLTSGPDRIQAVATDGHRLAIWNPLAPEEEEAGSVMVHGPIMDFLWQYRDQVASLTIESYDGKQYPIRIALSPIEDNQDVSGTVEFNLPLYEYPAYRHVLPLNCDAAITGNTFMVKQGLSEYRRAGFKEIYLRTEEGKLYSHGNHDSKKASTIKHRARIKIGELGSRNPYTEVMFVAGFNLQYFYDCIKSLEQDTFTIKLLGPLDPVVIETDDSIHVIMPMRI